MSETLLIKIAKQVSKKTYLTGMDKEDIQQELFLSMWQHWIAGVQDPQKLNVIAMRTRQEMVRKNKKQLPTSSNGSAEPIPNTYSEHPETILQEARKVLTDMERHIFDFLIEGKTETQVGAYIGYSQQHINRVKNQIIEKLQKNYPHAVKRLAANP